MSRRGNNGYAFATAPVWHALLKSPTLPTELSVAFRRHAVPSTPDLLFIRHFRRAALRALPADANGPRLLCVFDAMKKLWSNLFRLM